ncbi:hypothetical protein [Pontibacter anaerobius]|uniref:Metal resistance protein n=1 Tax=Pontibacter anaerobius TaxID=2993940 RepID=A0ABT3RC65_9BACT|nr:hypothetical protein [Pontibacter anaerobius]MCX2739008.1 hypothetical protein [Pontibacter anaerobius]
MAAIKRYRFYQNSDRSGLSWALLFLITCLLLTCPIKLELRAALNIARAVNPLPAQAAVAQEVPSLQQLQESCKATELTLLDKIDLESAQAPVLLKAPLVMALLVLPMLFLLMYYGRGAPSGQAHKNLSPLPIPLFLLHRSILL